MKSNNRRLIAFAIMLTMLLCPYQIFAHEAMLEVTYDDCVSSDDGSDMNEMWYILDWFNEQYHLG